ncbi:hypothetical protein [Arthrobacter sp. TWP1-1]|uniref:hypothetical protein n=1 Tax=Arthrobacter sp. TWP1-1 TaxID=2804568 RepID=UPI003CF06E9F
MHVVIRRSLCAAVFASGLLALGAGAANAADQSSAGASYSLAVVQSASTHSVVPAASVPTLSSGNQALGAAESAQLALVGSGWWPTYSAEPTLSSGNQALGAAVPANLVLAGSGWWPTYSAVPASGAAAPAQLVPTGSGWWPTYSVAQTLGSGIQSVGAAAPTQLVPTGSGWWPTYSAMRAIVAGIAMTLILRRFRGGS